MPRTYARKPSVRNDEERNALVTRWFRFALKAARMTELHDKPLQMLGYQTVNDFAVDALIRAAELWDETKGASFTTYLWQWVSLSIKARARVALRKASRIPISDGFDPDLVPDRDRVAEEEQRAEAIAEISGLMSRLTNKQREALRMLYYEGLHLTAAGKRLGVSKTAVSLRRDAAFAAARRLRARTG